MLRPPILVEPPATLPVDLVAIKRHLRIDDAVTEDDAELTEKLKAATQALDGYSGALGRALVTQTLSMAARSWCTRIRLPLAPIQSASVSYVGDDGALVELPEGDVVLDVDAVGWFVRPVTGSTWPTSSASESTIMVTFVAGYGAPAAVPSDIRLAIMLDVEMAYDRPEGERFKALRQQYRDIVDRNRRVGI